MASDVQDRAEPAASGGAVLATDAKLFDLCTIQTNNCLLSKLNNSTKSIQLVELLSLFDVRLG